MIERLGETLFRVPIPGREEPVSVVFLPERGEWGVVVLFSRGKQVMKGWNLTEEVAGLFHLLGKADSVMSAFQDDLVALIGSLAEEVDQEENQEEREQASAAL